MSRAELELQLRSARLEYAELVELSAACAIAHNVVGEFLVADYVESYPDALEMRPLAAEHAVRMRHRNCLNASLAIYACRTASLMLLAASAVLGLDTQLWPAITSACLAGVWGTALPDWIGTYFLKPEQTRHERWQKLRASGVAKSVRSTPVGSDIEVDRYNDGGAA